jgi:large subunit ribosomal protein L23
MHLYEVLLRPIQTEKTDILAEGLGQYVFEVAREANKRQIREAVEAIFEVKVADVRTMTMPGKGRRWGRHTTKTPAWKKAVVTLAPGERLDLFE